MKYLFMSEIDKDHVDEEGTSGVRTVEDPWRGRVNAMKKLMVDLRALIEEQAGNTVGPGTSKVADRAKFFESRIQAGLREGERQRNIDRARRRMRHQRLWLAREGVALDRAGNIDMSAMSKLTVVWDRDAQQQALTRVHIVNKLLCTDPAGQSRLDTGEMVSHFSGPGFGIYVMSQEGNIHISSHIVGHRHHISLLAGAPVAGAGEIRVKNGQIVFLSNKSGHYAPNRAHFLQVLHQLEKNGVPLDFIIKFHVSPSRRVVYPSYSAFRRAYENSDVPDYELGKLLQYSAHLNAAVLSRNNWKWQPADGGKACVVDISSNTPVSHKTVRQWLKSQGLKPDTSTSTGSFNFRTGGRFREAFLKPPAPPVAIDESLISSGYLA